MIARGRDVCDVLVRISPGWPHLLALTEGKEDETDEKEEDRLEHVQIMKAKGKGPPKKNKTKIGEYTRLIAWM